MAMQYSPLSAVDINKTGESWTQKNKERFEISLLPTTRVLGIREGRSTTTYQLPKLSNSLELTGSDWNPGDAHGAEKNLGFVDVSVSTKHREGRIISRPAKRSAPHAFRDLENNIVPIQLSGAYQHMSAEMVAYMTNASIYGTAKTFGGTGALDTYNADQTPDVDINTNLQPMIKWQSLGLKLECYMSRHVMTVLARHPVYSGAGTGSAIASTLPLDEFRRRFLAAHPQIDALHICDSVYNSARPGQTAAALLTANTLLWFGLIDRRGSYDLTSSESMDAPDGALMLAEARAPEVVSWEPEGSEVEKFAARYDFAVYFPRSGDDNASDFAHFYGASEIFTSTPA